MYLINDFFSLAGTANINPADVNIESSAGGAINYALGAGAPAGGRQAVRIAPAAAPVSAPARGAGARYVLVPVTDPRARGYY